MVTMDKAHAFLVAAAINRCALWKKIMDPTERLEVAALGQRAKAEPAHTEAAAMTATACVVLPAQL